MKKSAVRKCYRAGPTRVEVFFVGDAKLFVYDEDEEANERARTDAVKPQKRHHDISRDGATGFISSAIAVNQIIYDTVVPECARTPRIKHGRNLYHVRHVVSESCAVQQ